MHLKKVLLYLLFFMIWNENSGGFLVLIAVIDADTGRLLEGSNEHDGITNCEP